MAIAINATEWAFTTRLTTLATDTTLAASTRHDFAAITVEVPENTTRTFRSVFVAVDCRDAFTAATSLTGVRIGIKLAAVAFADTDLTITLGNTADHETFGPFLVDVTSYFNTNFGSGTSQTCQVGVAFATSAAGLVNNITAKLLVTYEASDAATTKARTVRIPIQGHHTTISTTDVEIGTTGGVSDAPANQIPQLTGSGSPFLPEASVSIKQAFIELWACDDGNAVTPFNLVIKIDSGGSDNTRATLEQALNTPAQFHDIFIYDTGTFSPTAAHALILRSSLAARFEMICARFVVTYTYDDSSTTTECRSLVLPIEVADSDALRDTSGTAAADRDRMSAFVDIQEPGTITLKQSGVMFDSTFNAAASWRAFANSQAERVYTHINVAFAGSRFASRRTDHDSGWTLARGRNTLPLDIYSTTASVIGSPTGYVILNYHAGRTLNGNVSAPYLGGATAAAAAGQTEFADWAQKPIIPETRYYISGVMARMFARSGNWSGISMALSGEKNSGESDGDGWWSKVKIGGGNVETGSRFANADLTQWFRRSHLETDRGVVTASRRWRVNSTASIAPGFEVWVTHHARTYAVAGTVTASDGTVIQVWDTVTKKLVGDGTVTSGAFSILVTSDVNSVFVTSPTGRSANGTPGSSTFNITGGDTATGGRLNRGLN